MARLGDPGTRDRAHRRAVAWRGRARAAPCDGVELVKLIDESRDPERACGAHLWRFTDLLELGDTRAVDFELGECRRIADRLRDPFHHAHVAVLGDAGSAEGRFEDAGRSPRIWCGAAERGQAPAMSSGSSSGCPSAGRGASAISPGAVSA
jgi:hypothetical protein